MCKEDCNFFQIVNHEGKIERCWIDDTRCQPFKNDVGNCVDFETKDKNKND